MFLAYLISCEDPLADEEAARLLAGDHPALQFMEAVGFKWPSTQVPTRAADRQIDAELLRLGYLKYKGYTVGKAGLTPNIRRQILVAVYNDDVPSGFPDYYIRQWGQPRSATRLKKMAGSIAAFCRNNKKKDNPPAQAISEWEADLAWIKIQFYDGHYRFRWPSAEVW